MPDDDLIQRLRSQEISDADQEAAHDEASKERQRVNQLIRDNARRAFREMQSIAKSLVERANAELDDKFTLFPIGEAFVVQRRNKTASFMYVPPTFSNVGCPQASVAFESAARTFGFAELEDEEIPGKAKWDLEPWWDTDSSSVKWSRDEKVYDAEHIVADALEQLR